MAENRPYVNLRERQQWAISGSFSLARDLPLFLGLSEFVKL
jgi:hypothetical protein